MKNLKRVFFGALLASQISGAVAQTDPVTRHVNITQDAVKTAIEEFNQQSTQTFTSADAEQKSKEFGKAVEAALVKYEKTIREEVLSPFRVLVNQYNSAWANHNLGEARVAVAKGIYDQLTALAEIKSRVYGQAVRELYSVMPELPFYITYIRGHSRYSEKYITTSGNERSFGRDTYLDYSHDINDHLAPAGLNVAGDSLKLLNDCYTSTCFYQTQALLITWHQLIRVKVAKPMEISLDSGEKVNIYSNMSSDPRRNVASFLSGYFIKLNLGEHTNLPTSASAERVRLLKAADQQLIQRRLNCRALSEISTDLCSKTQEGCLKETELNLLKARHPKVKCLETSL